MGITVQPINKRFPEMIVKGYKIYPLLVEQTTLGEAYQKEQMILKEKRSLSYMPQRKFNGHTECFKENPLKSIS